MTTNEVDRLERYLENRFNRLEEQFISMNDRVMHLERNVATLKVFAVLAGSIATVVVAAGIIRGIQYLAS